MQDKYPYKSLVTINTDAHEQLQSVIETFSDENLQVKVNNYDRSIAGIVSHTLTTEIQYFIKHLAMGNADAANYNEPQIATVREALEMIKKNLNESNSLINSFPEEKLNEVIATEWGTKMTREVAIWQGITQIMMHLGEITLMAGQAGFYQGTLG
jgi:uncharacterized damage-inducible protein DinB